jgi:hypothetical protein
MMITRQQRARTLAGLSGLISFAATYEVAAQSGTALPDEFGPAPGSEPIAGTAPAAGDAAAAASTDAEADALVAALAGGSGDDAADTALAEIEEFALSVYGFADFTYTHRLNDFAFASPYPTFMVGNVNLYVGAELGGGWRSLVEARLLYLPHGGVAASDALVAEPERINTTINDPADYGRPLRWGGVEIERAQLDYAAHSLLTLRVGQWLTPYGIWNVDHGSPVIIGVRRPYVVGESLFPERQTGVQALGSFITGRTEIGYNLGLSNGRGPVDSYQDLDENKAVTARLYVNAELPVGTLSVGTTLYRGTFTDRFTRTVFTPAGELGIEYISTARYDELGLAADLRWVWKDLTLQGELIMRETAYDDALRPVALPLPGAPLGFSADFRSVGWYALAAYRLPWWNIMPFIGGESYDPGQDLTQDAGAIWGGLNVRPTPRVVLKAQYTQSWFTDGTETVGADGIKVLDFQASWSF